MPSIALLSRALVATPDEAAEPTTACGYWKKLKRNPAADADNVLMGARRINGELNGTEQRRVFLAKAKTVVAKLSADRLKTGKDRQPPESPALRRGTDVTQVIERQRLLFGAGYRMTVDGRFEAGTEVAVKAFQQTQGLAPDGVVGPATWAKLRSAVPPVPRD